MFFVTKPTKPSKLFFYIGKPANRRLSGDGTVVPVANVSLWVL
jgi:hypothetical protein